MEQDSYRMYFHLTVVTQDKDWLPEFVLSLIGKYFLQYFEFSFLVLTAGTNQKQLRNWIKVNDKVNETAVITGMKNRNGFSKEFLT